MSYNTKPKTEVGQMKRFAVVVGLALASLVGWHSTSRAVCGWCDFSNLCRWEPNINFCCFGHMGDCWMFECPSCNIFEIEGLAGPDYRQNVARWKTHEPRFYGAAARQTIADWKGRGTIPPALLERYKARPEQMKSPILAEALRQRTHYDALRLLAKAGALGDNQALVDALLR